MIEFGVAFPQEGLKYDNIKKAILQIEKMGYDSGWLMDHLSYNNLPFLEAWVTLSSLASVTSTIRLGTMCTCNSYRYPSILAKMAASFDVISNGRLEFGIGTGWKKDEYISYGIPFANANVRVEQLKEAVQIIRKMWMEDSATFSGKHYKIEGAINFPKPVQKPHPPIWIGGVGEKLMLRVISELANAWNCANLSLEEFKHKSRVIDNYCIKYGRDPKDIRRTLLTNIIISERKEELKEEIEKMKKKARQLEKLRSIVEAPAEAILENAIVGNSSKVAEKLEAYIEAGATYLILIFPKADDLERLRVFADNVMQPLKERELR